MKIRVLFIVFVLVSCSKDSKKITYYDNGKIHKEYIHSTIKKYQGIIEQIDTTKVYYSNGNIDYILVEIKEFDKNTSYLSDSDNDLVGDVLNKIEYYTFFDDNQKKYLKTKIVNGSKQNSKRLDENGTLREEMNYIFNSDSISVKHSYKNNTLYIDSDYASWLASDTIVRPFYYKSYDEYGRIKSNGVIKPIVPSNDSDFDRNGNLSQLELDEYIQKIGLVDSNGRIIGATQLHHHKVKQDFFYTNKLNKQYERLILDDYKIFSGVNIVYSDESGDDTDVNYVKVVKDGLFLKSIFPKIEYKLDLLDYFYYEQLSERDFEFSLIDEQVNFTLDDLINSPQGKLIKN